MLTIETHGRVAVLNVDDGKANVVSEAFSKALNEGLDAAERIADTDAVLIAGRPGRFSAGFDLSVIRDGTPEQAAAMRRAGARIMHRLFVHPQPVVIACTGHALAAGALILLTGDTRIGARGDFKIGLNETSIGLALPTFGLELAKARMPATQLTANVIQARLHDPDSAVTAGYLDEVVESDQLMATALARATALAEISGDAYGTVKRRLRGESAKIIAESIDAI